MARLKRDRNDGTVPYARPLAVQYNRRAAGNWLQKVACPICGKAHQHGHEGMSVGGSPRVAHCHGMQALGEKRPHRPYQAVKGERLSSYWIPDVASKYLTEALKNPNVWIPVLED